MPASPSLRSSVCILGAGPHGLSLALHLLAADPQLRGRITVIDPSGEWMSNWYEQFARLEIGNLRSPGVHHPGTHVAFSFGSACIDEHTVNYLTTLELPPAGTVCGLDGVFGVQLADDLEIQDVMTGSAADVAGVQRGDRIVSIDGVAVSSLANITQLAGAVEATIELDRDGNIIEVTAIPDPPPWELWRLAE